MKYIFSIVIVLLAGWVHAQRVVVPFSHQWEFTKDIHSIENNQRTAAWRYVALPHTWNVEDVMDDEPGYYRGIGWYKKKFVAGKAMDKKELYLFFEGANQATTIFVNGKEAGTHIGGYTAFNVRITPFIKWGAENELLVKVDNSHNKNIPPLTADFTFYGGIYRQVSLIAVNPVHFSSGDDGSKGLFISTPEVSSKAATLKIKAIVSTNSSQAKNIITKIILYNAAGRLIKTLALNAEVFAGKDYLLDTGMVLEHPRLWSPSDPYLYKLVASIADKKTGKVMDEITMPVGFRWFKFDAEKGFFLNGLPLKLVGASRHQDFKGMGNAVPDSIARKDVQLIKNMGGNFLRVAHYPQDQSVLQACDELGILASVEIPVVNEITETDSFFNNSLQMQKEMIRQNFNHPSVIMWCYMNEVLLKPQFNNDKPRQQVYFSNITLLAKKLDSLTRSEDPYRYTMMANHGAYSRYRETGLTDIPMIVGWNLYAGWYGSDMKGFPAFLDQFHKDYPNTPMLVTEYGADADPRIRSLAPVRFDKSVEYTTLFHQYYLKEMLQRPFVAGAMVWNLADFNSETRNETMPHINNKGLLEWDRTPKDPYYYYKAILAKEPFVKILGSRLRGGIADSGSAVVYQNLQVASNFSSLQLFINGHPQQTAEVLNGIATWKLPFTNGKNTIEVKAVKAGKLFTDKMVIDFRLQPYMLTAKGAFNDLNILLGANRYFTDDQHNLWIPDQAYRTGSWGHTGGKIFKLPSGNLPYGTDKNIRGTFNDPVYQTQQTGIESYRLDVPKGNYRLTLHFAELVGGKVQQLVYNLDSAGRSEPAVKRIFDVVVNGRIILQNFNIEEQYGLATAVSKTVAITVKDNEGIYIEFRAITGEPVLNALQLKLLPVKRVKE